ncbi:MAG: hypothetical protein COU25_03760 [Candidatus Levybacteria bacterium CG10_big_fil_rev_8_21_14_0_10_35_13]|nr:MAG: hypothetical protein COU25_03760 [Candidatus Levybacteria bacterium CG10_big_fil_rev_8_21_14_0_10_35_13]
MHTYYQFSNLLSDLVNKEFLIVREFKFKNKRKEKKVAFEYIFGYISDIIKLEKKGIIIPSDVPIYSINLKNWIKYDAPVKIKSNEAEFLFRQLESNNLTFPLYYKKHNLNDVPFSLLIGEEVSKYFKEHN